MIDKTEKRDDLVTVALLAGGPVIVVGALAPLALIGAWRAFVISKLYGWFLAPLGLPPLNWWHVWGLLIILSAVTWANKKPEPPSGDGKAWVRLFGALLVPVVFFAFALLLGWLIKTWGLS